MLWVILWDSSEWPEYGVPTFQDMIVCAVKRSPSAKWFSVDHHQQLKKLAGMSLHAIFHFPGNSE